MRLILNILVSSFAVFITVRLLRGVTIDGFGTAVVVAVVVAVVLGVVNGVLGPVLLALSAPINVLTLGLFTFVVIGALVMLAAAIVPGFRVAGFWWALGFALVLAVVNSFFHSLAGA